MVMGKNGGSSKSWLSAVKNAFRSPNSKDASDKRSCRSEDLEQQEQEKKRGKRRWIFGKPLNYKEQSSLAKTSSNISCQNDDSVKSTILVTEEAEEERDHAIAVAMATTAAAEAAVATAQAAVEFIRMRAPSILVGQHQAAITIQKAFKGYLARRASRALKGVVLLQALIRGHNVRKRAELTLLRMQALIRVQTQVRYQRRRHSVSHESSISSSSFTDKIPISRDGDQEDNQSVVREVDSISMYKEPAWRSERDLAHAFSHKMWRSDREEYTDSEQQSGKPDWADKWKITNRYEIPGRYSCDQRIPIKIVQVENTDYQPSSNSLNQIEEHFYQQTALNPHLNSSVIHNSYKIPPSFRTPVKAYQPELQHLRVHSASPRIPREEEPMYSRSQTPSLGCCHRSNSALPGYMVETESARARVRSQSVPRKQMPPPTPEREGIGFPKRRLLFEAANEASSRTSTPRLRR